MEALHARSQEEIKEEILLMDILRDMLPTLPEQMSLRDQLIRMFVPDEVGMRSIHEWRMLASGGALPLGSTTDEGAVVKKTKKRPSSSESASSERRKRPKKKQVSEAPASTLNSPKESVRKESVSSAYKAVLRSNAMKPLSKPALSRHVDRLIAEFGLRIRPFDFFSVETGLPDRGDDAAVRGAPRARHPVDRTRPRSWALHRRLECRSEQPRIES